jgi:hypothetical protein
VVTETHIFQIAEPTRLLTADESGNKDMDIFEASTAQKKKPEDQAAKLHELLEAAAQTMPDPPPAIPTEPSPQRCYQTAAEDQQLVSEVKAWLVDGKPTHRRHPLMP